MLNKQRHIKSLTNINNGKSGVERIKMEREWQMVDLYSKNLDRCYTSKQLARNAMYCLMEYMDSIPMGISHEACWGLQIKNKENPVRLLTIAGALIAAELDRLRPAKKIPHPQKKKKMV